MRNQNKKMAIIPGRKRKKIAVLTMELRFLIDFVDS